jgi:hypothetical protein
MRFYTITNQKLETNGELLINSHKDTGYLHLLSMLFGTTLTCKETSLLRFKIRSQMEPPEPVLEESFLGNVKNCMTATLFRPSEPQFPRFKKTAPVPSFVNKSLGWSCKTFTAH